MDGQEAPGQAQTLRPVEGGSRGCSLAGIQRGCPSSKRGEEIKVKVKKVRGDKTQIIKCGQEHQGQQEKLLQVCG